MANVTIGTAAAIIVAANPKRQSLVLTNSGPAICYIGGDATVTTANGTYLEQDDVFSEDSGGTRMYKGPIYGICGANDAEIIYWEREGNI